MYVFGIRKVELQHLTSLVFDNFEHIRVFGYVRVQKIHVHVEQIVYQLSVGLVSIALVSLTIFQAIVSVATCPTKVVACYFVCPVHVNRFSMNGDSFDQNPLHWFLGSIPGESTA